jgi:uncharacterized membrane protein (Fun14 family)
MLVPVILIIMLAALIKKTAKKLDVSATPPLVVSVGIYVVFVLAARGIITVEEDQIQSVLSGVLTAIGLYVAVAVVVYIGVFIWMKIKSSSRKE